MQKKLQRGLVKNLFLFFFPFFLAVIPVVCLGQSVLASGELLIVNISSGNPVNFAFVPLVDLEEGTVIYFTDNAYISAEDSLAQTEGYLFYTAQETIPAGAVVSYNGAAQSFEGPGMEAGNAGDNILVFQTSDTDTTFIHGLGWGRGSTIWSYDSSAGADTRSDIPTGLSEDDYSIVSLRAGENHRYNLEKGAEGSRRTLARLIGNSENWYSGETASSEDSVSFRVLHPPVLRFSADSLSVSESESEISLSVELAETNHEPVSADVVFMQDLSTASGGNIGNYSTQTVRFTENDAAGSTKTVTVNLHDNDDYNGSRTAVFRLLNNTNGSVATPGVVEVEIEDKDVPDIVITEINADPGNDADGNGVTDGSDDEFVEFVNNESTDIDLSGWTFSDDGSTVRHVFPSGTILPASGALVLFANEEVEPVGNFGGAIIQNSNRSPTLHLNDRGDVPTLKDAAGNVVASHAYGSEANDNQSITGISGIDDSFGKHSEVAGYERLISSPGVGTDGASYGSEHRMGIRGGEGWRMISSPVQNTSFKELLDGFTVQGINGSDAPAGEATIYYWDETAGGTVVKPADITDIMEAGRGYMIYFFEDEETWTANSQSGFSKTLVADEAENNGPVSVEVFASDANGNGMIDQNEGFNLLGNPFGTYISVTAVLDALEKVDNSLNRNILVWNPMAGEGNGAHEILTDGDLIAPFQAFFARFMDEVKGNAVLNKADLQVRNMKTIYTETEEDRFGYKIALNDGSYSDTYQLIFREEGNAGPDRLDAYKLFSLNPGSLNLFSSEGDVRLMKNTLPDDLNTTLEVPLLFEVPEEEGTTSFEFSWERIGQIPQGWDIFLIDKELDKEINLRNSSGYEFSIVEEAVPSTNESSESLINQTETEAEEESRFILLVSPASGLTSAQESSESVKLNPNYPNPFNSTTRIPFILPAEAEIQLSVWNIVGQKVATLIDGVREAGPDEVLWNAADMPSGIYIAQMEVEGNVYIRKMTLIKY